MSPFMSSMPAAGLMEMPPVSKVTPLPMKATGFFFDPFGAPFHFMGDEHGLIAPGEEAKLAIGDIVTLATPHCDPTVNLYDFYQVAFGISSHAHHAMLLKLLLEIVVELIAMAMTFLYVFFLIDIEHARTLSQHTLVCSQSHGATHI